MSNSPHAASTAPPRPDPGSLPAPVFPIEPDWPEPLQFASRFLPDYFNAQPSTFHVELMRDLAAAANRRIARVAPRGHAKSTCAALAYPLWCICTHRRRNIVIITHENALATQFVRDLRSELESNERILEHFGDLTLPTPPAEPASSTRSRRRTKHAADASTPPMGKPRRSRWSQNLFTTNTGITVQAKGTGASFRGTRVGPHRPDLIICDDVEKDELVATPDGRRKLERWLRRVVMPALAPDGQLLVLGSIIHYDSLLANLRDRKKWPRWDYRVYRALEATPARDTRGNVDPHRFNKVALWPDRWSVQRLEQERDVIGSTAFEQEYQANPIDDSLRVFRPEWLQRYEPREIRNKTLIKLIAVDPATGTSNGDFFALWIGGYEPESGILYTLSLTLDRIGIVQQVKRIVAAFRTHNPVKVGIETVAYQVALKQILEEESRRASLFMPIVALPALANKRARIEGTAPFYENGLFRLPPNLSPEAEQQFLEFPKARHDDAPDVCAMGIALARSLRAQRLDAAAGTLINPSKSEW